MSVATLATQWERGHIIRRDLAQRIDVNDVYNENNNFRTIAVPTVQLHYNEMVSVGEEASGTFKNAMPAARIVSYNAAADIETQAGRVTEDIINALTAPLTERETFSGLWEFEAEPRYIAEGSYEELRWVMEGTLERCANTISSAQFTDGSPVAMPTEESVAKMLSYTSLPPNHVIGPIQTSGNPATVWDVAVQGVMAGVKPNLMPVLLAATECMVYTHDYGEQLNGAAGWFAYALVISGPMAGDREYWLGTGGPASMGPAPLTPGVPTTTAIGRFHRLMQVNVGGIQPGVAEAKGIGHPAKTSIVVAEAYRESGWPGMGTIIKKDPAGYKTGVVDDTKFRDDETTVSLFVNWGDMFFNMYRINSFTNATLSPGGVVPETRDEAAAMHGLNLNWLTNAQYRIARQSLAGTIVVGKILSVPQQGLTSFISVSAAQNMNKAGITREMSARFVAEFCADTNRYAQETHQLREFVQGAGFTVQGENMHEEWNNDFWLPALTEDPDARVQYYRNPKLINFIVGPSPMLMSGLPRWTASVDNYR